ncbi:MAG TPA: hypothetical protein PKE69_02915 [Pyrinomonadaceae bacterium]|nr:hypothetical protein [Pyrinomonadaceae bacterium]
MNTEQTQNELIIRETPGCLWIVGLFFAVVGGIFVYGALGGFADYSRHSPLMLAVALVMGSVGVGVGVWTIYNAPITKIVINRVENTVLMSRYGLLSREDSFYDFDQIEGFCLMEDRDTEGDPIWYFALQLIDDEPIRITSLASHSETYKREYVFRANEFMNKQLSSTEMIFEPQDEDEAKMS